jgi:hypothetical protein
LVARFPRLPAMLLLSVIVVVLVVPTARTVSGISLIDEREHIDNMLRGSHGRIGHPGQQLTQETLRELCARGRAAPFIPNYAPVAPFPACPSSGRLDPAAFAYKGVNTSTQDPPYYLVTGLTARALRALTPGWESLVTWARVLGAAWLLAGMYLVLRLGDLLEIDRKPLVAALVFVAALPTQLHAETTVNPDAMAFLAGAAILLAGLAWERGRANIAWLVTVSTIAVWLDRANAVALVIVFAYLALRAWRGARGGARERPSWTRVVAAGAAVAVAAVAVVGAWQAVERRLRPETAQTAQASEPGKVFPAESTPIRTGGFPFDSAFSGESLFGMLPPVQDIAPPVARSTGDNAVWYRTFSAAASAAIVGVLGAGLFGFSGTDRVRALAAATLLALVLTPVFNHIYNYFVNDYFVATVPRFGLSALPAIALVFAAIASRSKTAYVILIGLAAGIYATALVTLI